MNCKNENILQQEILNKNGIDCDLPQLISWLCRYYREFQCLVLLTNSTHTLSVSSGITCYELVMETITLLGHRRVLYCP